MLLPDFIPNLDLSTILTTALLVVALVIVLAFVVALILWSIKASRAKQQGIKTTFILVTLPSQNEVEIGAAEQMFAALASFPKQLSFEIVAKRGEIAFFVVCPNDLVDLLTKQINAAYPEAEMAATEPWDIWAEGGQVAFCDLKLTQPAYFPIKVYGDLTTDPLNGLTSAMSNLGEGEGMALQIMVKPAKSKWAKVGRGFVNTIRERAADPEKKSLPINEGLLSGIEKKIGKAGFSTTIRLVAVSPNAQVASSNLDNLLASFGQFADSSTNNHFKKRGLNFLNKNFVTQFIYTTFPIFRGGPGIILNTAELATIFHFPNKNVTTPYIIWLKARTSAAPVNLPTSGLYLGKSSFRGEERKVHLLPSDRLRHYYIIGQTGTGKSKLLEMMAYQDMVEGRGLAFIDPHGESVMELLKMVPPERIEDVIYFNPGDTEFPMGFNILDVATEEQKHLVINSFISLLYKLYDPNRQGMMGPRLERAIRNVMLTAMAEKGNTLVEVLRLLIDDKFAKSKLPLISDPLVKKYWTDELAQTSEYHKSETLGYFVSKFDRFVTEIVMRNIIGQPKTAFSFRKIMDEGKILMVNLAKGIIGDENSNFLGLLLVPQILGAAMGRAEVSEEQRRDFYLYVDEFQNFSTPDFVTILSEARKYHLSLNVANQFISQIPEDIKNAIFGNVGSMSIFRVGIDDANYLEGQFEPSFSANDLANNPIGSTYTRLLVEGQPTPPFSMATDWDMYTSIPRNQETVDKIIQLSRLKYGRKKEDVSADIERRLNL